jgi:hypothetical protein
VGAAVHVPFGALNADPDADPEIEPPKTKTAKSGN